MDDASSTLTLLRQGGLPLHLQAEEAIRRLTADPQYAHGGLLPDELTLAKRLGVSRGTVRAALARLVSQRCLERKAGVGTRVVKRSSESAMGAWRSFSREMARQGIDVQMFRLQLQEVAATNGVASALRVKAGAKLHRLDRVRGWNNTPILRSRSWFHPRVKFLVSETFTRPLYDIVSEACGLTAERASEAFEAEIATAALAQDLDVKRGAPLLLRRHTVFDSLDRPFELAEVHYVSGRFSLTLDLKRDAPWPRL